MSPPHSNLNLNNIKPLSERRNNDINNQKWMINSLLERSCRSIPLGRVMLDNNILTTEPDQISAKVNDNFKSVASDPSSIRHIPEDWLQDERWYDDRNIILND
jgi:hypothetical protein